VRSLAGVQDNSIKYNITFKKSFMIRPRVRIWFENDEGWGFGLGLVEILQAVDRTGSIKSAAVDLGRSYRHVWSRIKEAEAALGRPLAITTVGGRDTRRAEITDAARILIDEFLAIRDRTIEFMENECVNRLDRLSARSAKES
jgi:molybdate transport system regulatory protein